MRNQDFRAPQAGVELLGGQMDERGGGWRHFRAPDGNVYELTSG